jgi:hypothetical protein
MSEAEREEVAAAKTVMAATVANDRDGSGGNDNDGGSDREGSGGVVVTDLLGSAR